MFEFPDVRCTCGLKRCRIQMASASSPSFLWHSHQNSKFASWERSLIYHLL